MNLIYEILRSKWVLEDNVIESLKPKVMNLINGISVFDGHKPDKIMSELGATSSGENQSETGKVAVIEINGVLTKNGGLCSYGTSEIAQMIAEVEKNEHYIGGVLKIDSPGGSVNSIFPLEDVLSHKKKPWVGLVDLAASGGYYTASYMDCIIATNRMAEVGSIGVLCMIVDDTEKLKKEGINVIKVYPSISNFKHKVENEAKQGNLALMEEELEKWGLHFQDVVKRNRPNLNMSIEGLLNGKVFYAYEALENGLIDKIGNIDTAVDWINKEVLKREIVKNI